jgi:hypothetical protein
MNFTDDLGAISEKSPLSKRKPWLRWTGCILVVILLVLFWDILNATGESANPTTRLNNQGSRAAAVSCRSGDFARYGINTAGFTRQQEKIILQAVSSFAQMVGGPEQLKKLLTIYNDIPCQEIFFDPEGVGAYTDIRLTPTVFNVQAALAANYSHYFTVTEAEHARVVIGHEIGHLLGYAALRESGVDWMQRYRERVGRDWQNISSREAFEEEAVTQLSLAALGNGYYYRLQEDKIETDPQRAAEIQAWVSDFLQFLRGL